MPPTSFHALAEEGKRPSRLLLIRLRSLGDTVLMTPLPVVAKRVPGWLVAVVVEQPYQEVLEGNPYVDRLFVIAREQNKWMARWKVLNEIRAFHPTVALDLHGGSTSAILTALAGAPARVGYRRSRNSYLYNVKIPDSRQVWQREHVHTVEHQLSILKYLGFPVEPIPPLHVPVDPKKVQEVGQLLSTGRQEGFVLIHPAAAFDTKQWDPGKFSSLARKLAERGYPVVLTAGPGEENLLERIKKECPPEVEFVSPLSIGKFSALVSLCSLYIGNDTGSTHIAAALRKKIVVIFGSSDFEVWYPWETPHRLIRSDLPCIRCIRSIEVQPVFEAALSLL